MTAPFPLEELRAVVRWVVQWALEQPVPPDEAVSVTFEAGAQEPIHDSPVNLTPE